MTTETYNDNWSKDVMETEEPEIEESDVSKYRITHLPERLDWYGHVCLCGIIVIR